MINKPILLHYYYICSLFRCPLFLPNIHSKIPSGYHITFSHQVSRLLWAVTVSQTFLMLDDLRSSKETVLVKYFVRCPSIGIFPMFPSLLDQAMGYWEEDHKDGVSFWEYILSTWLAPINADLDHLAEVMSGRFLHEKVTHFPPLHTILFEGKSLFAQPTRKEWGFTLHSWG